MSEVTNDKMSPLDIVKWVLVVVCAAAIVVGNTKYAEVATLYRVLAVLAVFLVAMGIAATTTHGAAVVQLMKDARVEMKKVVWPTGQETMQTTVIVVIAILIMALLLWAFDSSLSFLIQEVIG